MWGGPGDSRWPDWGPEWGSKGGWGGSGKNGWGGGGTDGWGGGWGTPFPPCFSDGWADRGPWGPQWDCKGGWGGTGLYGKAGCKGKGPAPPWPTEAPEISEKIFVGSLPKDAGKETIARHFSQFGEVMEVNLKMDGSGSSRGFAFVTFASAESSRVVLDNYALNTLEGKWIDCKAAVPEAGRGGGKKGDAGKGNWKGSEGGGKGSKHSSRHWTDEDVTQKVFIGGLPQGTLEPEVRSYCEVFGKTREVALKYNSECVFRGFAFVTFESVDAARRMLSNPDGNVIMGKPVDCKPAPIVDFPRKRQREEEETTGPTPLTCGVIRVGGLPPEPKSRDVFKLFYNFSITRIRDCGGDDIYVEFSSKTEAEVAYRAKKEAAVAGNPVQLRPATEEEFARAATTMKSLLPESWQQH